MRLQKQGKNECYLATIAMVLDKTIEEVRDTALKLTGLIKWDDASTINYTTIRKYYGLPALFPEFSYYLPGIFNGVVKKPTSNDLQGIGTLWVKPYNLCQLPHIVAFENGIIYEPNGYVFNNYQAFEDYWAEREYSFDSCLITKIKE